MPRRDNRLPERKKVQKKVRKRLPAGVPNPVDIHVGNRLRTRRTLLGLSQEKLGDAVGLTFQQIQKYERGANRIGASRLYQFSRILEVHVGFFFEELPGTIKTVEGQVAQGLQAKDKRDRSVDPLTKRETLELVRAYYRIRSPSLRKRLRDLVIACVEPGSG